MPNPFNQVGVLSSQIGFPFKKLFLGLILRLKTSVKIRLLN